MKNIDKFRQIIEERISIAPNIYIESAYKVLLSQFNEMFKPGTILYTAEEVTNLCSKSFEAGQSYAIGSHKDLIQIHKGKNEFIESLNL